MGTDRVLLLGALAAVLVTSTGCAGARTSVVADGSAYPVSLSPVVRDAEGDIVTGERMVKVATFNTSETAMGFFYSAASTKKVDLSKQINAQVTKAGGDAIVNLKVKSATCASDWIPLATFIPLWPGCAKIAVRGDIIKVRPKVMVVRIGSAGTRIALLEALR